MRAQAESRGSVVQQDADERRFARFSQNIRCRTKHCRAVYEGALPPVVISNGHPVQHIALEALL